MIMGKVIKVDKRYNNFSILTVELENGKTKKLGGETPQVQENNFYKFDTYTKGKYTNIISYEEYIPKKEKEIIKFLTNINGIGKKTGQRIYDHFGEDTISILLEDINEIDKVRISKTVKENVKEYIKEKQKFKEISSKLEQLGIGIGDSYKLIDVLPEKHNIVVNVVHNPYMLIEYLNWTFHKADRLAMEIEISKTNANRIASAIRYILLNNQSQGHSCMDYYDFINELSKILDVDKSQLKTELFDISLMEGQEFLGYEQDNDLVFLKGTHYAEKMNAIYLKELAQAKIHTFASEIIDICIKRYQLESGIVLDKQQREAVHMVYANNISLFDGKPGAGKTTTLSAIMYVANSINKKPLTVKSAAPTGKAARQVGFNATTIHQLLEVVNQNGNNVFTYNKNNKLKDVDLILIDELSMVDMFLFHNFIQSIQTGTKILFVGDKDQLQSVKAGRIFEDMIESKVFAYIQLNENYRQSEGSYITKNANLLNQLKPMIIPNVNDKNDFKLYPFNEKDLLKETLNFAKICYKKYSENVYNYFQAITPYKNGTMGIYNLNKELQKIFNPASVDKPEIIKAGATYRKGDKVMQLRNYKEYDVNNGEDGIIKEVNSKDKTIVIDFDGEPIEYDFEEMEKIQHSFCITIHKSQGSEYPIVYIPMATEKLLTYTKRLFYTAMTRAKDLLILAGNTKVLDYIYSTVAPSRKTNFTYYIQSEFGYENKKEVEVIEEIERDIMPELPTLDLSGVNFDWAD